MWPTLVRSAIVVVVIIIIIIIIITTKSSNYLHVTKICSETYNFCAFFSLLFYGALCIEII
jgi:hypothetical protein